MYEIRWHEYVCAFMYHTYPYPKNHITNMRTSIPGYVWIYRMQAFTVCTSLYRDIYEYYVPQSPQFSNLDGCVCMYFWNYLLEGMTFDRALDDYRIYIAI